MAKRLLALPGGDSERIQSTFEMAQTHPPGPDEITEHLSFVETYAQQAASVPSPPSDAKLAAWTGLARVLLTGNAFLYLDYPPAMDSLPITSRREFWRCASGGFGALPLSGMLSETVLSARFPKPPSCAGRRIVLNRRGRGALLPDSRQ